MVSTGGGNALFVLRMIWQASPSKVPRSRFSTAVIDRDSAQTKSTPWTGSSLFPGLKALSSRSEATEDSEPVNFLEEESTEYNSIATILPSRDLSPRPIPWPTIFAHAESSSDAIKQRRARLCDPLARLVMEKDLASAQKIYHELRSHKAPIMHRTVYLEAANQCLEGMDTDGFLFWLRMYPNRPATRSHPELKATWAPVVTKILARHASDLDFLEAFLLEAARKGLLPVIITPMLQHLTYMMDPTRCRLVFERAFAAYLANTTPKNPHAVSEQGQRHISIAQGQVNKWWGTFERLSEAQGWSEPKTLRRAMGKDGTVEVMGPVEPLSSHNKRRDRIAQAIAEPPPAKELSDLIWDVECGTPEAVEDLRQAFIYPADASATSITPAAREILWTRAVMIMYARVKDHAKVIEAYQSVFTWYGLPDHPLRATRDDTPLDVEKMLIYPRNTVITTLMPSLLATLPVEDLTKFHQTYLSTSISLPPALRPDAHIHNIFVNEITHRVSLEAGESAVESIVTHGYDPGSQSMTSLLLAYARKRMMGDMHGLLSSMERGDEFASNGGDPLGRTIPAPTVETYDWLIKSLRNRAPEESARLAELKTVYFGSVSVELESEERAQMTSTG